MTLKYLKTYSSIQTIIVVQNDLFCLQDWSDDWLLLFHPDKCIVIRISLPWKQDYIKPRIFHAKIRWNFVSNCEKYVGVYIDAHLTFETHIVPKVNKANSTWAL